MIGTYTSTLTKYGQCIYLSQSPNTSIKAISLNKHQTINITFKQHNGRQPKATRGLTVLPGGGLLCGTVEPYTLQYVDTNTNVCHFVCELKYEPRCISASDEYVFVCGDSEIHKYKL